MRPLNADAQSVGKTSCSLRLHTRFCSACLLLLPPQRLVQASRLVFGFLASFSPVRAPNRRRSGWVRLRPVGTDCGRLGAPFPETSTRQLTTRCAAADFPSSPVPPRPKAVAPSLMRTARCMCWRRPTAPKVSIWRTKNCRTSFRTKFFCQ